MKWFWASFLIIYSICSANAQTNDTPDYRPAITRVLKSFQLAISNSTVLVTPSKGEVNTAAITGGVIPKPHKVIVQAKLVQEMAAISLLGCPDDFKAAWKSLALALAKPTKRPLAEVLGEGLSHGYTGVAGEVIKAADAKEEKKQELKTAVFNLQLTCSSYGVN